jgi:hypothetical protein
LLLTANWSLCAIRRWWRRHAPPFCFFALGILVCPFEAPVSQSEKVTEPVAVVRFEKLVHAFLPTISSPEDSSPTLGGSIVNNRVCHFKLWRMRIFVEDALQVADEHLPI